MNFNSNDSGNSIIENIPDSMYCLDKDLNFIFFNKVFIENVKELNGIEPHLGENISSYYPFDLTCLLSNEINRLFETTDKAYVRLKFFGYRDKDYKITISLIYQNFAAPIGVSIVECEINDIRFSQETEHQRASERRNNEAIINSINDLIWSFDTNLNLIAANNAFYKSILKLTGQKIQPGDSIMLDFYINQKDYWKNWYLRSLNGERFKIENKIELLDPPYERWIEVSFNPIYENHTVIGATCFKTDITEKKHAAERIRLNEERFRALVIGGSEMISIMDTDGNYSFVSPSVISALGYTPESFIGKNVQDLIHPDDFAKVLVQFNRVISEKKITLEPFRVKNSKGVWRWFDSIITNMLDEPSIAGIVTNTRDITDRKEAEFKLIKSERRFKALIENCYDGWIVLNSNGEIEEISSVALKLVENILRDENKYFDITKIHVDDRLLVLNAFEEVIINPEVSQIYECRVLEADGSFKWLETVYSNMLGHTDVNALVLNVRDITARKKIEEEKKLLVSELIQRNADLKQFSYITSHNLRAPLTNLLAIIDVLEWPEDLDSNAQLLLQSFKTSTFQLNNTLNDLAKILTIKESRNLPKMDIRFESIFVPLLKSMEQILKNGNILVNYDFKEAETVYFDVNYLGSILLNLLTNSIKYCSPDRQPVISLKTTTLRNGVILTFSDNGIGMDMKLVKDKIFGLYQCFHDFPDSRGIGLYLIHSQITSLGGQISVKSTIDGGTTFTIRFLQKPNRC